MMHLYGGLNPVNVWDMAYEEFIILMIATDAHIEQQRAAAASRKG